MSPKDIEVGKTYRIRPGKYRTDLTSWRVTGIHYVPGYKSPWIDGVGNDDSTGSVRASDLA